MGDDHSLKYDAEGVDRASGKSYKVLVWEGSPSEEYSDADALHTRNKLLFELKDWRGLSSGEGSIPYYIVRAEYHVTGRLSVEYLSCNRKYLKERLDRYETPLAARNDTIRLVIDNPAWTAGVVGLHVRVDYWRDESIDTRTIPRRQQEEEEEEEEEEEGEEEEEEEEGEEGEEDEDRPITDEAMYTLLEHFTITPSHEQERETCCSVCLEEFSLGCQVTKLPCSHVFHQQCILVWLFEHCFCPFCRFKLPSISKEDYLLSPMALYYKQHLPELYVFIRDDN